MSEDFPGQEEFQKEYGEFNPDPFSEFNRLYPMWYVLDENERPVPAESTLAWGDWMHDRSPWGGSAVPVARDYVGDILISTVFLGLDHSFAWGPGHAPVLWETMVFGGKYDQEQERYTSAAEARAGHAYWLAKVKATRTWRDRLRWWCKLLTGRVRRWGHHILKRRDDGED